MLSRKKPALITSGTKIGIYPKSKHTSETEGTIPFDCISETGVINSQAHNSTLK